MPLCAAMQTHKLPLYVLIKMKGKVNERITRMIPQQPMTVQTFVLLLAHTTQCHISECRSLYYEMYDEII